MLQLPARRADRSAAAGNRAMSVLLTSVAAGDPNAVEAFLHRYNSMVYGLARRFCRSAEDAEDATQEIFVEVWKSADRYDASLGSEATFLMTIARRRLIDRAQAALQQLRPERRQGRRPPTDLLEDAAIIPAPPVADRAELHDEVDRAQAALQQLRPEQRQVLDLALVEGRTHQEIAMAIGIPLGTVKSHARRGLMKLRALLGADVDGTTGPDADGARS
jgi:RNA polymerase sigma factor (sigma-70 family)